MLVWNFLTKKKTQIWRSSERVTNFYVFEIGIRFSFPTFWKNGFWFFLEWIVISTNVLVESTHIINFSKVINFPTVTYRCRHRELIIYLSQTLRVKSNKETEISVTVWVTKNEHLPWIGKLRNFWWNILKYLWKMVKILPIWLNGS